MLARLRRWIDVHFVSPALWDEAWRIVRSVRQQAPGARDVDKDWSELTDEEKTARFNWHYRKTIRGFLAIERYCPYGLFSRKNPTRRKYWPRFRATAGDD